jgi:endonuclease/exonuclease/phosphatase family metal-dependent hydrolase
LGDVHLRVLTWNLMHGRSVPSAGHDLFGEFAAALATWEWDVALLQEVPPWWPPALARGLRAEYRQVLTSRNGLLPARRAAAQRWPDVIRSNGGGANAILARHDRIIGERSRRLCRFPERRWAHAVQLGSGIWLVNLHATAHSTPRAQRDGRLAAASATEWARGGPLVLGGDFNLRAPAWPGFVPVAGHDVDHILVAGALARCGEPVQLDRGRLSDHVPIAASLRLVTS